MPGPIIAAAGPAIVSTVATGNVTPPGAAKGFADSLNKLLEAAEQSSASANTAVGNMLNGTGDVHEAMIALQRAETSLELTIQVRNKLVQAYQEIMRMPV